MFHYPIYPIAGNLNHIDYKNYFVQPKWDGWRLVITPQKEYYTRHGNKLNWKTLKIFDNLNFNYNLDCELIHLEGHHKVTSLRKNINNIKLIIFDIMISDLTIEDRLELLNIKIDNPYVEIIETKSFSCKEDLMNWNILNNLLCEGFVFKKKKSLYIPGIYGPSSNNDWIKWRKNKL